ncbi:hypothetical protein [Streptomyces avermitilis]|uniref:hypothetical protein n=1 Tax=Streptomyces avermitilis TaxID=33903 RepID=UPI0038008DFA
MDYAAMYRQAMADGATDYARSIITSAVQAAQAEVISPEQLSELVDEVNANPPE